jgi:hypothetical protein
LTKAGGRVDSAGTGLERRDLDVCSTAPCYGYRANSASTVYNTMEKACLAQLNSLGGTAYKYQTFGVPAANSSRSEYAWDGGQYGAGTTGGCYFYNHTSGSTNWGTVATTAGTVTTSSIAAIAPVFLPSSMNDISPYMARSDVNPDGRVVSELLDKGADITMPLPTVTGPASVVGPASTTVNPDNTKSVTQTTHNFTNSGNTVTNTSNVTTTNNYNSSNVVTSTTTKTEVPVSADPTPDPCDANPTRAGCAKLGDAPTTEKLSKTSQAVNVVAQTFAGGGSCPPPVNFALSVGPIRGSYGFSYSPLCNALVLIRGVILALAGLMAAYILADSFKV